MKKSDYFLSDPGGLTSTLSGWTTKKIVSLPYQIKKKGVYINSTLQYPPITKPSGLQSFEIIGFLQFLVIGRFQVYFYEAQYC